MKLQLNSSKPVLQNSHLFCDFRVSKAYLWGLIHDRVSDIRKNCSSPIKILDAACHALITRQIFPLDAHYFGLDISRTRLLSGMKVKCKQDVLLHADLTHPLPCTSSFDVVVSCNTMSHLPPTEQLSAISNLIECCKYDSDLLVNLKISSELMPIVKSLLTSFRSVEPIYFDSFLTTSLEKKGKISSSSIQSLIQKYEYSVPNDASCHDQVLLHAHSRSSKSNAKYDLTHLSTLAINQITPLPRLYLHTFHNDNNAISSIQFSGNSILLLSPFFFQSPSSDTIKHFAYNHQFSCHVLDDNLELPTIETSYFIFGLETEWVGNVSPVRLIINKLRSSSLSSIHFVSVSKRDSRPCTKSLLLGDI